MVSLETGFYYSPLLWLIPEKGFSSAYGAELLEREREREKKGYVILQDPAQNCPVSEICFFHSLVRVNCVSIPPSSFYSSVLHFWLTLSCVTFFLIVSSPGALSNCCHRQIELLHQHFPIKSNFWSCVQVSKVSRCQSFPLCRTPRLEFLGYSDHSHRKACSGNYNYLFPV